LTSERRRVWGGGGRGRKTGSGVAGGGREMPRCQKTEGGEKTGLRDLKKNSYLFGFDEVRKKRKV